MGVGRAARLRASVPRQLPRVIDYSASVKFLQIPHCCNSRAAPSIELKNLIVYLTADILNNDR